MLLMRYGAKLSASETSQPVISVSGAESELLAAAIEKMLMTYPPSQRRGALKLIVAWLDSFDTNKENVVDLVRLGPQRFRMMLRNWQRNHSGRFSWDWDGSIAHFFLDNTPDEDVTDAVNCVLKAHFKSSRRKYLPFLASYINFEAVPGECPHAFITESVECVRYRFNNWLEFEQDLIVNVLNGQADSSVDVRSENGPINHWALGISAIRQLYAVLQNACHLRPGPNPLDIDGLDEMGFQEKLELARTKFGQVRRLPKHFGSQYSVKGRVSYVPIPHDPLRTYVTMREAVDELGNVPPVIQNLLAIMDADGPRHHDIKDKCADAWAVSKFGDWMHAGNKGSADPAFKNVVFGPAVGDQMRRRIDDAHFADAGRPSTVDELINQVNQRQFPKPSMGQLEELRTRGRWDILAKIPLFPAAHGDAYSYSGWNRWIRRAMDRANGGQGATIATTIGPVRPTAVWLRRAMFTERVKHAAAHCKDIDELKAKMDVIRMDAGHRSEGPIYRYIASIVPDLFERPRHERAAESRARMEAGRANLAVLTDSIGPPSSLSSRSQRLRGRARE